MLSGGDKNRKIRGPQNRALCYICGMNPPKAEQKLETKEVFGHVFEDNYAWLRQKEAPEVLAYLNAENEYMEHKTAHTKEFRDELFKEMLGRIKEDDRSVPAKKGNYWYYYRTVEGKPYQIHCRKKGSLEAEEEILVDENILGEGLDFFSLGDYDISPDEKFLAYTTDSDGSEEYDLTVIDLASREVLSQSVKKIYPSVEWANDSRHLFFVRQDAKTKRPFQLYRHDLSGENQDALVFEEPNESFFLTLDKSSDEEYIFISLNSIVASEVHYLNAATPLGDFQVTFTRREKIEYHLDHHEGWFYYVTNENAVNFKLMRRKVEGGDSEEIVAHDPLGKLDYPEAFEDHLVIFGRRDGLKKILVLNLRTFEKHYIPWEEPVHTVWPESNLEYKTDKFRMHYASPLTPVSVFEYDLNDGGKRLLKENEVLGGYDRSQYELERVWIEARDGAKIPVSLVYKKGLKRDGENPMYLYAYGSYGVSVDPYFSSNRFSLLDRGVIFAIAHIRGGGEMGELWYQNGKFLKKWNTFFDFIDCAQWLIEQKYTSTPRLAIGGGSAGGLLMGAVVNTRPDLFSAVVAHVPFVDVMNTMLDPSIPLTVIEYDEWGNPNKEEFFRYMLSYSPYENVKEVAYPHLLITAGLNDPRVGYWEPAKWCALLRTRNQSDKDLILKTNMGAGHQGKSGRYGYLEEVAFDYAFILEKTQK